MGFSLKEQLSVVFIDIQLIFFLFCYTVIGILKFQECMKKNYFILQNSNHYIPQNDSIRYLEQKMCPIFKHKYGLKTWNLKIKNGNAYILPETYNSAFLIYLLTTSYLVQPSWLLVDYERIYVAKIITTFFDMCMKIWLKSGNKGVISLK